MKLEPQKVHSSSGDRPLLCRFQSQQKPLRYVLSPGRSYVFDARDEGGFDLRRAKTDRDGVALDTRELKVLAVADQGYRRGYPQWQERVQGLIADVSNHFDDGFGIRLSVIECQNWNRPVPADNLSVPLTQLFDIPTGDADLVIGFTILQMPQQSQSVALGTTTHFGQYIAIQEPTDPALMSRGKVILLHELCHVFGAFHLADRRSVMQPNIGTVPRQVSVTDVTRRIIRLTRNMDLRKGVESLDHETTQQISELYRVHHHPESVDDDPIAAGYCYQSLMAWTKGDTRRTRQMAAQVLQRTPRNFGAWMLFGAAAAKDNDGPEAERGFRQAIRLKPQSAEGYAGVGLALLLQQKTAGAQQMADYAVQLDPKSQMAQAVRTACKQVAEVEASTKQFMERLKKAAKDAESAAAAPKK